MDAVASQAKRFAHYEILHKLGRSMTDVYLAFDPRLNRRVILKVIEESRDEHTQLVIEAEKRGAQIQSDLHRVDPRVLEVYEFGTAENCFFVAMEYFEGRNIAELLRIERRLDPKRAARYAAEICNQLGRLHSFISEVDPDLRATRRAVVHGDIKPSNIQIGRNDELKLLDFGIAKVITYTRNLTQHNLGSPTYCSPERLAKGQVDPQSDLWAVGVSLYEMVAGSPPYQAQDTRKLEILIESRRPPRALPENCPAALGAIISKALAGEVNRRYASAADFETDLRAFLEDRSTVAFSERRASWEANATVQKSKPAVIRSEPRPPHVRIALHQLRQRLKLSGFDWPRAASIGVAIVAVFFFAYLLGRAREEFAGPREPLDYSRASIAEINRDWAHYQQLRQRDRFLGRWSPAAARSPEIRSALASAGTEIVDSYRNSSDPSIANFAWAKAHVCFRHALELDPGDRAIASKLALSEGYLNLIQNPKLPKAALSESSFHKAAARMPRYQDPHLALAHLYVYAYQNIGRARAEFQEAERLGFHLGPREIEQEADGYLFRAESELKHAQAAHTGQARYLRLTAGDLDRARNLYEPISGFSNISQSITRLDQDFDRLHKLEEVPLKPVTHHPPKHPRRKATSHSRWR